MNETPSEKELSEKRILLKKDEGYNAYDNAPVKSEPVLPISLFNLRSSLRTEAQGRFSEDMNPISKAGADKRKLYRSYTSRFSILPLYTLSLSSFREPNIFVHILRHVLILYNAIKTASLER
jgi:hypothetical protein